MRASSLMPLLPLIALGCGEALPPPQPTVAVVEPVRQQVQIEQGGATIDVSRSLRVEEGATVTTSATGRGDLRLDNGAKLLVDQSTAVEVTLTQARLTKGRLWVDTSNAEETTVETASGTITAAGAAFSVSLTEGNHAEVYCASGELSFRAGNAGGRLQQGESITLGGAAAEPRPEALWDDWTGGLADPSTRLTQDPAAVGVLAGRQIGDTGQARVPVPIRAHDVSITVTGDLAETEVLQSFFNARSETIEAEYTIRLPAEAIVTGFAISRGRQEFVDGAVGPVLMAGDQPSWSGGPTGPSALTWDGPERLRARIFPINPGETVRVRLRYAEWLQRQEGQRSYVYPMGVEGEPPLLGEFTLSADLSSADATAVRAGMGARVDSRRVLLRRSDFRPRADFYLDLLDEADQEGEGIAHAYIVDAPEGDQASGDEAYVLLDVPTELEADATDSDAPLELVLLVDVSGGLDVEHLELARATVEAALQQLAPEDRVALLLGDVTGHAAEGTTAALQEANDSVRESILEALARASLGGATDLSRSLTDAAVLVAGRPRGAVLYIGDGQPTTGALDATSIRTSLSALEAPPRFFAIGLGEGANIGLLRTLFGDGARPVLERTEASRQVMQLLAEASRPTLRGLEVELGPTVERIYPSVVLAQPLGEHLRMVGRLNGTLPEQLVLRGHRDGQPFEQTYQLREHREDDRSGYIRRRWATHRFAELLDQGARQELLQSLATRFDIITPWTALIVGGTRGMHYAPVQGFDHDPTALARELSGGSSPAPGEANQRALESTWTPRTSRGASSATSGGDGGVARAAISRALAEGERAPRTCFERRLLARPELRGQVSVRVTVSGGGAVTDVTVTTSTVRDPTVERCLVSEVQGIRFPTTGSTGAVTADHSYTFAAPSRELGAPRRCSLAASKPLRQRRTLWSERLESNPGVAGAIAIYQGAEDQCELGTWLARRTLLSLMLRHVGELSQRVQLYQFFGPGSSMSAFLKREILRTVHTPQQMAIVRAGLGLEVSVDWNVFLADWARDPAPAARLGLVRRWLEAVPWDIDLRLRLVRLLEQTDATGEARRAARELAEDPLCDAAARGQLAEFWMRQDEIVEARRTLSEIVERTPLDPWSHRRVGDLYLAFGWGEGAYREYSTLARLRPADPDVTLLLARAAAAAGRTDEALRLEQRLSESVSPNADQGTAAYARLWTAVHLARLETSAGDDAQRRAAVARRQRSSGVLRDRPLLFAALTWEHPDRRPELFVRYPSSSSTDAFERVPLRGGAFGIEALRVSDHDPGAYHFEVRRPPGDDVATEAHILVVSMPGTTDQHIVEVPVTLAPDVPAVRFRLTETGDLEPAPIES